MPVALLLVFFVLNLSLPTALHFSEILCDPLKQSVVYFDRIDYIILNGLWTHVQGSHGKGQFYRKSTDI
tara:strand:+ start:350 stop:556 length:207 start_codon:yes stop_codon:yes gene_type:complete